MMRDSSTALNAKRFSKQTRLGVSAVDGRLESKAVATLYYDASAAISECHQVGMRIWVCRGCVMNAPPREKLHLVTS